MAGFRFEVKADRGPCQSGHPRREGTSLYLQNITYHKGLNLSSSGGYGMIWGELARTLVRYSIALTLPSPKGRGGIDWISACAGMTSS